MATTSEKKIRVLQLGLGPIGISCAKLALSKQTVELCGVVDVDPKLAGKDLVERIPEASGRGLMVAPDLAKALEDTKPDVVLQCTGSRLQPNLDQILTCVRHGAAVVSSMEELLWPYRRYPAESLAIDEAARENGVAVLGTGVNPGFVMDTLVLCLSGASRELRSITVRRVVDASSRRGPLQRKIGAGLEVDAFRRDVAAGKLGHVGLVESAELIAVALGLGPTKFEETIEPLLAEAPITTEHVIVQAGQVRGLHHRAWSGDGVGNRGLTKVELDLRMALGEPNPVDEVILDGDPRLHCRIEGGVAGDQATAAMLVNSVPRVYTAPAGLQTMATLPLVYWCG